MSTLFPFFQIRLLPPTSFLRECKIITRVIYPNLIIICKWIAINNCYAFTNMLCYRICLDVNSYRWDEVIFLNMNPLGNLSIRIKPMSVWFKRHTLTIVLFWFLGMEMWILVVRRSNKYVTNIIYFWLQNVTAGYYLFELREVAEP